MEQPVQNFTHVAARGMTLVELLVVLVILSILAGAALPFAEMAVKRNKELELKRNLRTIRVAIDEFHLDWIEKRITNLDGAASQDGFPKTLQVLIDGVSHANNLPGKKRYLRRIPSNPFADQRLAPSEQWLLRSYQDKTDTQSWGGQDVYDISVMTEQKAIDGSNYHEW